jgi:hypothetical protein
VTVQDLYDLTQKNGDPRKTEIRLRQHGDEIAQVQFEEDEGQLYASLIEEGAIHL